MNHATISLKRRHLLIAGMAAVAAPAAIFAAPADGERRNAPAVAGVTASAESLIVSGRVVGTDGRPLAGASVEAWQAGESSPRASATTDADGRFMFATTARAGNGGRPQFLVYRISHHDHRVLETRLDFAHAADSGGGPRARLQRDEAGVWRAAVGVTLA